MPLPLSDAQISNITGYMSLACWIVVYSPQIWENYQLKSGEGLSVTFIVLWLLGDITNALGGALANLLPTVVILAVYYTACDIVLLIQVYYYRHLARQKAKKQGNSESSPLLESEIRQPPAQPKPLLPPSLEYPLLLLFVLGAGVAAYYLSDTPDDVSIPEKPGKGSEVELEWKSQTLGWLSAALYLGSRVPQIAHNYKTRCAGLSLAMFFFSISGNITYVISILIISVQRRYLVANASWLVGSGFTVFLDLFVLGQFAVFSWQDRKAEEARLLQDGEGDSEA